MPDMALMGPVTKVELVSVRLMGLGNNHHHSP